MEIVLATSNKGKLREFKQMCQANILSFQELLGDIEVEETENSFAGNAILKAKEIYNKLVEQYGKHYIVVADDSGLVVDALGGEPGIYSARYAGDNASDQENMDKLINNLTQKSLASSKAHYTCAIAIVSKYDTYCVHGWVHGSIDTTPKGDQGFGYDPLFTPDGYTQTMAEISPELKSKISHRAKALVLAKPIIEMLKRY
ncbi:MAG: RdgB/HAM1 family non-canonical purine NTP pyrophosphatase [Campylobacterales bacterium]|nr:RdgB/HAM1 family non-canonical purine NTP pyrophosphatase [Campylobacterales bacterium]